MEWFQRKGWLLIFPILFTYGTFFSIKWVFVLMVKQKLRVFYRGNIARFDLFINHDAANDSSLSVKKEGLWIWSILKWLRKHAPFQIWTLLFPQQKPTNVKFVRLLKEVLMSKKGKFFNNDCLTQALLRRCSFKT